MLCLICKRNIKANCLDGEGEKDQLILSRDLQLKGELLKWEFHDMKTGDVVYMDYGATIKDVYAEWMKKKSRL